ncbi:nucleotidyltransferase domain-containing protein [Hymenobacter sp. IS2118]|uniref:nucleotidyltransferase domain-containing protein n=1 Tax=Hymenobacter sp. IS2118 TaxID=1505605 RepID=UPI00068B24F9|nr:nucleotidyltransferase domain-containing protein [Hymenobacter sp. IS2118]
MLTQSVALERVRAFAESIRSQSIGLRKVILFGSYARNEQREFSDIDVALVADAFTGFGFQDVGLLSNAIIQKQFVDIEPHTFSPEQFTDWNPFVQEIKRTGIVIGEWGFTAPEHPAIHR